MRLEKECWRCETLNENDAERCIVCNEWIGDPLAHSMDILRLALQEGWMEKAVFEKQVRKEFGPSVEPYLLALHLMLCNLPEAKGRTGPVASPSAKASPVAEKDTSIDLGGGVKLDLVWVAPGRFLMGSSDSGEENARPVHEVQITKGFWMGKTPVTQEQWERVMGSNPSYFKGPKNPVEKVSWEGCQRFMQELNLRVSGGGFSLPTEAQWEYACRAGSTGEYCFGDDESRLNEYAWYNENNESRLSEYAWYNENSGDTTHPVGEKKPNAWGLYDMRGNVFEWCQDWYGAYAPGAQTDPAGAASGSCPVARGGCWESSGEGCGLASRQSVCTPRLVDFRLGFRTVRTLP